MRLLWLLSLRLAATRADACAAATAQIQGQTCNATSLTLDCSEKYLSIIKCGGITYLFSRKELIIPVNGELVKKHEQRARVSIDNGWTPSMPASRAKVFGVSENTAYACVDDVLVAYGGIGEPRVRKSAAAIRARLSGRCRADRDEACENCYSPHSSTLCPFSLTARAAAVETGVELVLAPAVGQELRWVLPRHARPPWRLPQHAPLV
jgi:hypothetical protein